MLFFFQVLIHLKFSVHFGSMIMLIYLSHCIMEVLKLLTRGLSMVLSDLT